MKNPDYHNAIQKAWELIDKLQINTIPINPLTVYSLLAISYETYSNAENHGYSEIINTLRMKKIDAVCYKDDSDYIVFYDDKAHRSRIPFTLAHELGHILLEHHAHAENGFLTRVSYTIPRDYKEKEADIFAGELLRARPLLYLTNLTNLSDASTVSDVFNISFSCARVGIESLNYINYDRIPKTLKFFKRRFFSFIHTKYCSTCNQKLLTKNTSIKYCPICGKNSLFWYNKNSITLHLFQDPETGELPIMNYRTYKTNSNGQIEQCPKCDFENIDRKWKFCPICSLPTQNKCTSCNELLEPHFRYCTNCGNPSLYYEEEALEDWNVETLKTQQITLEDYENGNYPNDPDNPDLPF